MTPQARRDREISGQPGFAISPAPFHRWARWDPRHHIIPPFTRKDTASTDRREPFVLRSLIGSPAEDGARRRGISAETGERIVASPRAEPRPIDPPRLITDLGPEERSLKKRHRPSGTWLSDLSVPTRPQVRAGARGQDTAAAPKGWDLLSEEPRPPIRTHRGDLGSASPAACAPRRKHSRAVTDRFPGAQKFNEAVDAPRKN